MAARVPTKKKSLVQKIDDELTCAICFSRFENPKVLPCLHLYCEKCLETMVSRARDKTKLSCPQCQEVHQVPARGVSGLKTYFTINNLLELMQIQEAAENPESKSSPKCTNCLDEYKAVARCLTCSEYLCAECLASHKRTRRTFSHSVLTLEEIMKSEKATGLKSLTKKLYCQEHEEEVLKLYCKTCKEAICRDCTVIKHKTHDYVFVKDFRPEVHGNLQDLIKTVRAKEKEFRGQIQSLDEVTTRNADSLKDHETVIQARFQQLKTAIDQRCETLLAELRSTYKEQNENVEVEKNRVSGALVRLTNGIKFTQQLLEKGDDLEVVSMSVQATDTLQELYIMKLNTSQKPVELNYKLDLEPILTSIDKLGSFSPQGSWLLDQVPENECDNIMDLDYSIQQEKEPFNFEDSDF